MPAVRLLADLPQPVAVDGNLVTLWHEVPQVGPQPTGTDLGRILRRIHALAPPAELPGWNPLDGIRTRLADAEELDNDDHSFLTAVCDELETGIGEIEFALPPAVVHGDATVANLIPGPHIPIICDFDSTSCGPPEWDLTPVAVGNIRFNNTTDSHALLAASYGVNITTWPYFPVLRRIRELQLVTSVVPVLRSNPHAATTVATPAEDLPGRQHSGTMATVQIAEYQARIRSANAARSVCRRTSRGSVVISSWRLSTGMPSTDTASATLLASVT